MTETSIEGGESEMKVLIAAQIGDRIYHDPKEIGEIIGRHTERLRTDYELRQVMASQEERQKPEMPEGGLFEFCYRDYWESRDTQQLIVWISGISDYLCDEIEDEDLTLSLGNFYIDYTGSGREFDDFHEVSFETTELYEFLCWASQRLVWLDRTTAIEG